MEEFAVPVAPTGSLSRRGSTADGAMQIIRDDVAALSRPQLEQFGPVLHPKHGPHVLESLGVRLTGFCDRHVRVSPELNRL